MGETIITRRGGGGSEIDFTKAKGYFHGIMGAGENGIMFNDGSKKLNMFDYSYVLIMGGRIEPGSTANIAVVFLKVDKANKSVIKQKISRYHGPIGIGNAVPDITYYCEYDKDYKTWLLKGTVPAGRSEMDVYAVLIK